MKHLLICLGIIFYAVCVYFHLQDALKIHEQFLRLSPAEQIQVLQAWDEEEEEEQNNRLESDS
jgi:hypothetical protein